ncbi:UNVERIFIED_CONTAM: movement protein [Sesamum angustifolium]|uniref:Movement protein n=1 Tax=Sesamum angustifolium TaxID=2727405 RepID=A0AAW2J9W2_9LAMI
MDLQPSQNNYSEEDRLQTSESLSGFFSRMTISNKTMERIMRQDSNLSPYDGFRIGGIGKVLNQIGLNQRKHHIIYKVSSGKLMFDIHPRIAYNPADQDFSRVLTLHQDFKRKDLMKEGNRPYSITYRIAYALSNTHHSDLFLRKEYIEIPRIFKEFLRIEYSSRMSFSEDRIIGYKGKEKDLARVLTPQEIRVDNQPVIDRYEGMLEIAGHEILVTGVAGRENGSMILGISFLKDHKPWGRKGNEYFAAYIDSGSGICTAKPGVFPKEARETLPVIAGRDFSQKILILNTGIREAKIMIGGAFGTPWFRGLIDSDSFYKESEEEIENLKEALVELKTMDISEESKLSLENVKRLIQRNFSENPLAWWDRNKIEATLKIKEECKYEYVRYKPIQMNMEDKKDMQMIIKEHINLGLIEPGISAYSSPGFLIKMESESKKFTAFSTPQGIELQEHIVEKIRNFPDILKDKKQLQSFLGVVNFAGIFIKDLAKYRKDFRPLLKETESAKWKWEEIHTQRVRELKQVCNNLPKLAIPQDEDELVVYTDANDYRWAAVLMKKTTTGKNLVDTLEGCSQSNKPKCGTSTRKNSLRFPDEMEASEANSIMLRLRHLRENLEELNREFGRLVNAQVAGQVQRADLDLVQTNIRSSLVASTALWNALQEPIRKASPS